MLIVTPIYAALLTLLFLGLSARVIIYRRANRLSLGDEGDRSLRKRMRAQANCAEYVPIGVLLLLLLELSGAPVWGLHLMGAFFTAGRLLHGYGFSASPPVLRLRVFGMMLTLIPLALGAVALLIMAVL